MRAKDFPPAGAGACGIVAFQSKATPANRAKLKMVCNSFVAFFPRSETATAPLKDQMITIWPIERPGAPETKGDNCDFAVAHYDLNAAQAAMKDARRQRASFDGEGPILSAGRHPATPDCRTNWFWWSTCLPITIRPSLTRNSCFGKSKLWNNPPDGEVAFRSKAFARDSNFC
jgi:hypothetical protein